MPSVLATQTGTDTGSCGGEGGGGERVFCDFCGTMSIIIGVGVLATQTGTDTGRRGRKGGGGERVSRVCGF